MSVKTIGIAPVKKTVVVKAPQARAFEIFTSGVDRWWPKAHHLGATPLVKSIIEPRLGGRWYSEHEDGSQTLTGHMRAWEPPSRVIFTWEINASWKPDSTVASEVEVRFIAEDASTTRVELEHRNFEVLGEEGGTAMRNSVDGGWTGILELFKATAEA